jgi:DNA modification methylase
MPDYTIHHGDCTIFHGDCMHVMSTMIDDSVQAVVTDPPYNVGLSYEGGQTDNRDDYKQWCAEWFAECKRISSGPVVIACGISNVPMWCEIEHPIWIVAWFKPGATGRSVWGGFNTWEPALVYNSVVKKRDQDSFRANIITPGLNWHPCPKPIGWGIDLVRLTTNKGEEVFDPFTGSGTVGVACRMLGRGFTGAEYSSEYATKAQLRINNILGEQLDLIDNNR